MNLEDIFPRKATEEEIIYKPKFINVEEKNKRRKMNKIQRDSRKRNRF